MKKLSKGVKASIGFFVASVVTTGISYITTPIYTRLLSTEVYGKVSIFLTWLQVFGIIAMFCLQAGVFNNGMLKYKDNRDEYSFSMLILSNIITLCFAAVLFCLYPLIKQFIGLDWPFLLLMTIVFLTQPAYNFWVSRQRYELKYKWTLLWSVVSAVLSPLVAVLCIIFTKGDNKLYPRIFGAEITLILIYICFYVFLAIKNKGKVKTLYWKEAFLFNLPLIPHYLSIYLLGSSDKLMISYLVNDEATAYYSVAHAVAFVATIIWGAVNGSLVPYTYEKCKDNDYSSVNRATMPLLFVFATGCVLVIMLAPEVVRIMATSNYMESIYVIPPIVGGVFFQALYYVFANILYYHRRPVFVMIGSITAVITNIVLNYFCIKRWGYMAAGYTTLVCYAIQALIDFIFMRKVAKSSVYNIGLLVILSIIVVIIALLSNLIYDYPNARYAIVIFVGVLLFVSKDKLVSLFTFNKRNSGEGNKTV